MADKGYKKAGRKYWLKMRDDFFQLKHIRMMRKKSCDYVVAYQQMMVSTIKTDGIFEYHPELFDSLADEIAEHIDMDVHIVDEVFRILKAYKLVEIYAGGCMFIEAVENTDSESESAQRVREHRERLKKGLHCNGDVTNCNDIKEEDIEEETEEETEEDTAQQKADSWSVFLGIISDVIPESKLRNPEKCRKLLESRIEETRLTAEELGNCLKDYFTDFTAGSDLQFFKQLERILGDAYGETLKSYVTKKAKEKKKAQQEEEEHINLWDSDDSEEEESPDLLNSERWGVFLRCADDRLMPKSEEEQMHCVELLEKRCNAGYTAEEIALCIDEVESEYRRCGIKERNYLEMLGNYFTKVAEKIDIRRKKQALTNQREEAELPF